MRSRSLSTKLIFVFLFLAVAAYFSVQAYRYFVDPQTTTLVYAYSSEDAIAATGYFARDEQVIACSETLLELERAEGERVNAGGTLATVYRSESALNDHRQLRALRSRLEQLRYAREAQARRRHPRRPLCAARFPCRRELDKRRVHRRGTAHDSPQARIRLRGHR